MQIEEHKPVKDPIGNRTYEQADRKDQWWEWKVTSMLVYSTFDTARVAQGNELIMFMEPRVSALLLVQIRFQRTTLDYAVADIFYFGVVV